MREKVSLRTADPSPASHDRTAIMSLGPSGVPVFTPCVHDVINQELSAVAVIHSRNISFSLGLVAQTVVAV